MQDLRSAHQSTRINPDGWPVGRRRQEEAFARQYENEHTWEALQEDEHGLLRVVRARVALVAPLEIDATRRPGGGPGCPCLLHHLERTTLWQDRTLEQRAKRQRTLLSAAQSAHIRKGMIRYLLLVGLSCSLDVTCPLSSPVRSRKPVHTASVHARCFSSLC